MAAKGTGKPPAAGTGAKKGKEAGPPAAGTRSRGRPRSPRGPGRPRVVIDPKKVISLASYGCTVEEIAAVMECSKDTLERRFSEELRTGRNGRNGMLRAKIFTLASKSAAAAIFLAKNYLGMTDRPSPDGLTDEELLARAREEGIDPGTVGEAPSPASEKEAAEPTN